MVGKVGGDEVRSPSGTGLGLQLEAEAEDSGIGGGDDGECHVARAQATCRQHGMGLQEWKQ